MRQGIFYFFPIFLWWVIANLFNVPRAADLRAQFQQAVQQQAAKTGPDGNAVGPAGQLTNGLDEARKAAGSRGQMMLPPAVQRRHQRLKALRDGSA